MRFLLSLPLVSRRLFNRRDRRPIGGGMRSTECHSIVKRCWASICDVYGMLCEAGVRSAVECLARSRLEETQQCACRLLRTLAEGNPRFQTQVYHGLISLLSCSSAVAQHMAAQSLRIVQVIQCTGRLIIIL